MAFFSLGGVDLEKKLSWANKFGTEKQDEMGKKAAKSRHDLA